MGGIFESIDTDNKKQTDVNNIILELVNEMKTITEFSTSELKAISLCSTDKFLSALLVKFVLNKKHIKRKYSKEVREIIKNLASITQINGGQ